MFTEKNDIGLDTSITNTRWKREFKFILLLSIVIKSAYFFQYLSLPFLQGPIFDSLVYLRQAQAIVEADYGHPTLVAFSPLFGYFSAFWRSNPVLIVMSQFVLGFINIFLVHKIAMRFSNPRLALFASVFYVGYGFPLSYETKILSDSLGLFLAFLSVERYTSGSFKQGILSSSLTSGFVFGLSVLARASLLFSVPFFVVCSLFSWGIYDLSLRKRLKRTFGWLLGACLIFSANGLWNYYHTGLFVPVIMVSKTVERTTALSNNTANQAPSPWDVVRQADERIRLHAAGIPESHSSLFNINFSGLIKKAPYKIFYLFSDREMTFDYPYYGERKKISTLDILPISFGTILFFAIMGVFQLFRLKKNRFIIPLLPLFLGTIAVTTFYHPSSHYRLQIIIPMLILVPHGITYLWNLQIPRLKYLSQVFVVGVVLAFAAHNWFYELKHPGTFEAILASSYARAGNREKAIFHAQRALTLEPNSREVRQRLETFGRFH